MQLIDNVNLRLGDDLKNTLTRGSKMSIAASAFSIYAYETLKAELNGIEALRFIFTSPTFIEERFQKESRHFYIPHIYKEADLCGGEFEIRLKNALTQRAIAKECSQWVRQKVTFKSNKHANVPLYGMIHVQNADDRRLNLLEIEMEKLKSSIAKSKQFNRTVDLNLELKKKEQEILNLLDS